MTLPVIVAELIYRMPQVNRAAKQRHAWLYLTFAAKLGGLEKILPKNQRSMLTSLRFPRTKCARDNSVA